MYRITASFIVIGGCLYGRERGSLNSIERVRVKLVNNTLEIDSKIIGRTNLPRRSPSVFRESSGYSVYGGCAQEGVHLDSSETLTYHNNEMQSVNRSSVAHPHSCAAFCNLSTDVKVIIGGYDGTSCLDVVWIEKADGSVKNYRLHSRFKNSFAIADNTEVLLFGGWDEARTLSTVFRFSLMEDEPSLSMIALLPYGVEGHACVRKGNNIFIIGGYDGVSVINSIIKYNIDTKESEVLPSKLEIARENHVAYCALDKYIIVCAGWNGRESLASIEVFEILDDHPFLHKLPCSFNLISPRNRPSLVEE